MSSVFCLFAQVKTEVSQDKRRGYEETRCLMSLHIVPSIQYRKADQPEGIAMGSMYSRGLILFHSDFVFLWVQYADLISASSLSPR